MNTILLTVCVRKSFAQSCVDVFFSEKSIEIKNLSTFLIYLLSDCNSHIFYVIKIVRISFLQLGLLQYKSRFFSHLVDCWVKIVIENLNLGKLHGFKCHSWLHQAVGLGSLNDITFLLYSHKERLKSFPLSCCSYLSSQETQCTFFKLTSLPCTHLQPEGHQPGSLRKDGQSDPQDAAPAANQSPGTARRLKEQNRWDVTLQQKLSCISQRCTKPEPWKHHKNIV